MKKLVLFITCLIIATSTLWAADHYTFSNNNLYYIITGDTSVCITYPKYGESKYYLPTNPTIPHYTYTYYNGYTKPTGDLTIPSSVKYNGKNYIVT